MDLESIIKDLFNQEREVIRFIFIFVWKILFEKLLWVKKFLVWFWQLILNIAFLRYINSFDFSIKLSLIEGIATWNRNYEYD